MTTALITGATGGIGRELAALAARDGHDLLLTARSETQLRALASALQAAFGVAVHVVALDLAEEDAANRLHDYATRHHIDVDMLVNNAGFGDWAEYVHADWSKIRSMMQVNMVTLAQLAYLFGRDMSERGHGRILNIASVAATMAGPYMAMYFATKSFVRSLSEALSHELRHSGVSVTCVCPGPTTTGFEKAAAMGGTHNFFTMTRPASPRALAAFAYRSMMHGRTLAYHGLTAKAGMFVEHMLPRALTRRIAAFMNGGQPRGDRTR